jgi:hypothetical protein
MLKLNRAFPAVLVAIALPLLVLGCDDDGDDDAIDPHTIVTVVTEGGGTPVVVLEPTGPTVVPSPPDLTTDVPPGTTAAAGGSTVEMGVGTYCWTTMCVDKIGPITRDALSIASGDEVVVAVPDGVPVLNEVSVEAFPAANPQEFDNGDTAWRPDFNFDGTMAYELDQDGVRIPVSLEPGTYVLVVGMYFQSGDVQYGVVLHVE